MTGFTRWRKAGRSGPQNECVEVAVDGGRVGLRDSKNPGPVLEFGDEQFSRLLNGIKHG